MGNSQLRDIADIEEAQLSDYRGQTVAIDAHQWLYSYMTGLIRYRDESLYTTTDGTEVANLVALLRGLPMLLQEDINPIYVFDGEPSEMKAGEIESRREAKEEAAAKMEAAADRGDTEAVRRYKAQTQSLTPTVHETTRTMLSHLGIPYLEAPGSGEGYAAALVKDGHADAVLTDDYDALLFGAPETVRNYSGNGPAERMSLDETLQTHEIDHEQLVDVALLMGSDFNDGVRGIGPKRGVKYIREHGSAEAVLEQRDATIDHLADLRDLFLNPDIGSTPERQPRQTKPDYTAAVSHARNWELPGKFIRDNFDRFPDY
jgi:flap endonuclease-1